MVLRLSPVNVVSEQLLQSTKELQMNLTNGPITPLHHIFATLVAKTLTELSDRVETQVEAQAGIKAMSDALENEQILYRSSDGLGWDTSIRDRLHRRKIYTPPPNANPDNTSPISQSNMAGLQHLAAAAVGEREGADARPASSNGTPSHPKNDHDLSAAMAAANEAAKAQATAAAAQQLSASSATE